MKSADLEHNEMREEFSRIRPDFNFTCSVTTAAPHTVAPRTPEAAEYVTRTAQPELIEFAAALLLNLAAGVRRPLEPVSPTRENERQLKRFKAAPPQVADEPKVSKCTPAVMRDSNRALNLTALQKDGAITTATIKKSLGLKPPEADRAIKYLLQEGIYCHDESGKRGRYRLTDPYMHLVRGPQHHPMPTI